MWLHIENLQQSNEDIKKEMEHNLDKLRSELQESWDQNSALMAKYEALQRKTDDSRTQ